VHDSGICWNDPDIAISWPFKDADIRALQYCRISLRRTGSFYQHLLGAGARWGIRLDYIIQEKPIGLAHAFVLGREFLGGDRVALILGDNLLYGHGLSAELANAVARADGATVFAYYVNEPCARSERLLLDLANKLAGSGSNPARRRPCSEKFQIFLARSNFMQRGTS
jgi:Nucleotidyl transferase